MKLNEKRGLTRDFVSVILKDMKNADSQEDFTRKSVDYSSLEHQNVQQKINHLKTVIDAMHQLNVIINNYCIEQIEALGKASIRRREEEIDFIDRIDPRAIITKREAAYFSDRSESWLQKGDHKKQFVQERNGSVNVLSFATYLKEHKPLDYQVFIRKYQKELQSKCR